MPIRHQPSHEVSPAELETGVRERPSDPPIAAASSAGKDDSAAERADREHAAADLVERDETSTSDERGTRFLQRQGFLSEVPARESFFRRSDDTRDKRKELTGPGDSAAAELVEPDGESSEQSAAADEPESSDEPEPPPAEPAPEPAPEPEPEPTPEAEADSVDVPVDELESDDAYELQDHEFTLEPDDTTLEIAPQLSGLHPVSLAPPPLPPWAAASRALLDDSLVRDEHSDRTVEIPPPPDCEDDLAPPANGMLQREWVSDPWSDVAETPSSARRTTSRPPGAPVDDADDADLRERLATLARHSRAREVYLQEVERALAGANGRLRGQAFRIAELERELEAARAGTQIPREHPASKTKPRASTARPRKKAPAASAKRKSAKQSTRSATLAAPAKRKRPANKSARAGTGLAPAKRKRTATKPSKRRQRHQPRERAS